MQDQDAIVVKNLSKSFVLPHQKAKSIKSLFLSFGMSTGTEKETQKALQEISFSVQKGEFFGIVGRNGSGKSTLLKILAGIYQPTKGSVITKGKLVPFIELGVGFNPELSGRDNVYLNGAMLGFSAKETEAKYKYIVEFAELEKFMDQKLKNYSSGMQVRLAFSVATILAESDILLLDEVLAVGDASFQKKCYEYFAQLKKQKKTVVFVTHDMSAVQQYCDRAMLIEDSKVVGIGSGNEISLLYNKLFQTAPKSGAPEVKTKIRKTASGDERWGDSAAVWEKTSVSFVGGADGDADPQFVVITSQGIAKQDVDFPIVGFSIKNSQFQQLVGQNTIRINKKIKPLKKNQKFVVEWKVPNIFADGKFYVDVTIAQNQAQQVCDRWPDAASFSMTRSVKTPYLIQTNVEFSLERTKQ